MRVLFITGEFPPMQGGVGDCTRELAQALAERGVDVGVLTSTKAEGGRMRDEQGNFYPSSFSLYPLVKHWGWSSLRIITQTIREFRPSIVHLQFQTAAFGMHPAIYFLPRSLALGDYSPRSGAERGRARVRGCVTFHDLNLPYLFPKAGPTRQWITRWLARTCDAVVATNDEDYVKLATWDLSRLSLIPIGSNISTTPPAGYQRAAWRAQLGIAEIETLLCYFGFLNESKGGETLIRALARVPNGKLLMIGGQVGASDPTNAAYLARVKALIAELGLNRRVVWTDYTPPDSVTANFFASDLCVMPYRDGASYRRGTLMAALAHGCAIITTSPNVQTLPATSLPPLRDALNCLLVPPNDPRALADAIQRASASPALCAKIGAGARTLAQHFTWDKIAQQHLDLYQQILQ